MPPVVPARAARIQRLYCCAGGDSGGPTAPADIVEAGFQGQLFYFAYPEAFTGDAGPIVITMPDGPPWLTLVDYGDGGFEILGDFPEVPGPLTYEIVATDESGSTTLLITFNLAVALLIIAPEDSPFTTSGVEGEPLEVTLGAFTISNGGFPTAITLDFDGMNSTWGSSASPATGEFSLSGVFPVPGDVPYTVIVQYPGALNHPLVINGNHVISTADPE